MGDAICRKPRQYTKTSEIIEIDPGIDLPPKISDNEVPTDQFTEVTDVTEENNNCASLDEIEKGAKKQKMGPYMELKKGKCKIPSESDSVDEVVVEYECSKCPATFEENMDDLLQH